MSGVQFPVTDAVPPASAKKNWNSRSTTKTGMAILGAALGAAATGTSAAAVAKLERERKWRFGYAPHFVAVAAEMASADVSIALRVAEAGLAKCREVMVFARDGTETPVGDIGRESAQWVKVSSAPPMMTGREVGGAEGGNLGCIDVPHEGKAYRGDELVSLVEGWCANGTAEPSFGASIREVVDNGADWLDLRGHTFILLGATSEMGPYDHLLQCGATVVGLARGNSRSKPDKWGSMKRRAAASPGTLIYPSAGVGDSPEGADITTQTPEVIEWLLSLDEVAKAPADHVHVYSGVYLDGAAFVTASVAMNEIVTALIEQLPHPPSLLYIDTPSHCHVVPTAVRDGSNALSATAPGLLKALGAVGLAKRTPFVAAADGSAERVVMNGLASLQGPNYALAKYLQRWQAIVARHKGCAVSITCGPGAKTASIMHSPTLAIMMNNLDATAPPNMAMEPTTVQALMTMILIRDIRSPNAIARAGNALAHPMDLASENAWHAGAWRSPFDMGSVGIACFIRHYSRKYGVVALVGVLALMYWLLK